jgi:Helix-turn-helix domain
MMGDPSTKSEPTIRRMWGRRFLASTVVVPPDVAEHLNTDAMAVLAVIRSEAQTTGRCSLPVAQIAERANIGRAKVRVAIKLAESLGIIAIEETPPGGKRVIINRGIMSRC